MQFSLNLSGVSATFKVKFFKHKNFPTKMEFELAFVKIPEAKIRVDAAIGCGKRIEGVAFIHNPYLIKPDGTLAAGLELAKPLGFGAVQKILNRWSQLVFSEQT